MTNVFNSLNSLVWLLVLILVIAAVVVVVRALLAPRAGPPAASEPPVVHHQPVVQQPMQTSGLAPGWYPDQNDPNSVRYFDGRVWTSATQPRN
jgi:negative regulator of sigma E activity